MEARRNLGNLPVLLAWILAGLGFGTLLLLVAVVQSPTLILFAAAGLVVCIPIFLRPELGLLLTAVAIPLEELGRFTSVKALVVLSVAKILGVVTLAAWGLRTVVHRDPVRVPRDLLLLGSFVVLAATTLLYTPSTGTGVQTAIRLTATVSFYLVVVNLAADRRMLRGTLLALVVASSLAGAFSLGQRFMPSFAIETVGDINHEAQAGVHLDVSEGSTGVVARSGGTSGSPHVFAASLLVLIPLLLWYARTARTRFHAVLAWGAFGLAAVNLVLTHTRTALVVLAVVLIWLWWRGVVKLNVQRIAVGALVTMALLPFAPNTVWERLFSASAYTRSDTFGTRLSYWRSGLEMLQENWLTGMGLANFTELPKYNEHATEGFGFMHNVYLQMWNEVGLLGFAALMGFFVLAWRAFRNAELVFRRRGDEDMALLAVACRVAFASTLILGMTIDFIHLVGKDWWLVTAFGACLLAIAREEPARPPREPAPT